MQGVKVTETALVTPSNSSVKRAVAQSRGAIGYMSLGYVDQKVKAVRVDGVRCNAATVKDGSYPFARALWVYASDPDNAAQKAFVDFLVGPEGQALAESLGIVGVR